MSDVLSTMTQAHLLPPTATRHDQDIAERDATIATLTARGESFEAEHLQLYEDHLTALNTVEQLTAENVRLREALTWYTDRKKYTPDYRNQYRTLIMEDHGRVARTALADTDKEDHDE